MAKNWIAGAIKHSGALRAKAAKAHGINKEGKIKGSFLAKEAKSGSTTTKRQVALARTLKKMHK
jgi:hypothetical protein